MTRVPINRESEWLEADGLGGFASGSTAGVNTRRYHALLLSAARPPADRMALVNDLAVWLDTGDRVRPLSQHHYAPGVLSQRDSTLYEFTSEPWPHFRYALDDVSYVQEIVVRHGAPVVLVRFRFSRALPGATLCVRPLLSGRGFHNLHRENPSFDFSVRPRGRALELTPYRGVPSVLMLASTRFEAAPDWYRNFCYERERERGLDDIEDLASPGVFRFDLSEPTATLVLAADSPEARALLGGRSAEEVAVDITRAELERRAQFSTPIERAADAYIVKRGAGKTIIAGYPWFGDWGRDTFIALRGLCLATERYAEARDILRAWSTVVDRGLLPNRFPDSAADAPEYNSVDAALWYVLCVGELLSSASAAEVLSADDRRALTDAVERIIRGHLAGSLHGIAVDGDGLLRAGAPGLQLTWMDSKIGDWVVTPRSGKPVEIQALWLNALHTAGALGLDFGELLARGQASFRARFWNAERGCLFDVVDVEHELGRNDARIRPNQILAAGGLPLSLLSPAEARQVLDVVERELWTPLGPRSLSPSDPDYVGHYEGGVHARDSAYHQGTVWPWLAGPFIEAWIESRGATPDAKRTAHARFVVPLRAHLLDAGIGHVSEIADAAAPHLPRGCPFQAWSVAELVRIEALLRHQLELERGSVGGLAVRLHPELDEVAVAVEL